jgi:ABC-type transporter Mla subunit MlaD
MKYKFNPFERAVGLFLSLAIIGSVGISLGIAIKKNLFEDKVFYYSFIGNAGNIRIGSGVFLDGLKIGNIEELELDGEGRLKVKYSVLQKFVHTITIGTKIQFNRPFIFGDKVLTIIRSDTSKEKIPSLALIPTVESFDVMDVLTGEKMSDILARFDSITLNLNELIMASRDIALQVREKDKIKKILNNLTLASHQLKHAPQMAKDASVVMANLNQITTELNELRPAFSKVVNQLPHGTEKSIQLLNETVTTIKALQKNFLLKNHVEQVKKEEQAIRSPASDNTP